MLDPEGAVAEDLNAQMQQIGRGLVQINLRLTRVLEVVEKGGGPSASGDQALEALLDLLDAIERTFDAEYPAPRAPWWARLLGQPAPQARKLSELEALAGLKLARTDALARLQIQGIEPVPSAGAVDPRLHAVIDTRPAPKASEDGSDLHGQIVETHRRGWMRRGDPPTAIRPAHVTAYTRAP